jgi:AbrB family looped-hinge helix DNA binding protein
MHYQSNMTSEGQVTVPKDIRDALGLEPGHAVRFEMDAHGHARITKGETDEAIEQRRADLRARLKKAQEIFKRSDTMPGISVDEYMALIREPLQPFEIDPQQ